MHRLRERFPFSSIRSAVCCIHRTAGLRTAFGLPSVIEYPIRRGFSRCRLLVVSRPILAWKPVRPLQTILIVRQCSSFGFSPDILWPSYRSHCYFRIVLGTVQSTIPSRSNPISFFSFFGFSNAVLVPIMKTFLESLVDAVLE